MIWIYRQHMEPEPGKSKRESEHEAGRRLLRLALKERYGIGGGEGKGEKAKADTELECFLGAHGKPYLRNHPDIYFNISHCKGLVVCAVGDCEVGIDAEPVRPYKEVLLQKVLSGDERIFMEAAEEAMRPELFFRFWTLKESYVKAVGCGITVPLSELSFCIGKEGTRLSGTRGWSFWQQKLGDYVISACAAGEGEIRLAGQEERP